MKTDKEIKNETDFWETVPVRWIKYTKRKPHWNGSVYLQFNGKNQGHAMYNDKLGIYKLEGDKVTQEFIKNYEDTFYWLEQLPNAVEYIEGIGYKVKSP